MGKHLAQTTYHQKANTDTTAAVIYKLNQEAWELRRIPEEWQSGYIVKLSKRGNVAECTNLRGIQLLALFSKIYTRLTLNKIKNIIDSRLRDELGGFGPGGSCTEQITTLQHLTVP